MRKLRINQTRQRISLLLAAMLLLSLLGSLMLTVSAKELPCQTAVATGHYRHPETGVIEDSGGDANEALGQSMVGNVVDSQALVEEAADGTYLVSLRFNLMNNLSDIKLSTQKAGSSAWSAVSYERTASGDDTGDLRFAVADTDVIIRAECMVDAMGRYVIFFITLDSFTDGNAGGFVQSETDLSDNEETISAKETASIEESASIKETASIKESEATTSSLLDDVEGLTIGGSATPLASAVTTAAAAEGTAVAATGTVTAATDLPPQELNISGQVWFMLFLIVFCATLLGGMALWGIQTWLRRMLDKRASEADAIADSAESGADFSAEDISLEAIDFEDIDFEEPDLDNTSLKESGEHEIS